MLTAQDDGAEKSPDPILLDRAAELQKVLFTRDDDLLASAAYRQENELHFSGVIDAHQLQVSIGVVSGNWNYLQMMGIHKIWKTRLTS